MDCIIRSIQTYSSKSLYGQWKKPIEISKYELYNPYKKQLCIAASFNELIISVLSSLVFFRKGYRNLNTMHLLQSLATVAFILNKHMLKIKILLTAWKILMSLSFRACKSMTCLAEHNISWQLFTISNLLRNCWVHLSLFSYPN